LGGIREFAIETQTPRRDKVFKDQITKQNKKQTNKNKKKTPKKKKKKTNERMKQRMR